MAIVKDYIHPNGARVRVHDDCYAGITPEELARRRREVSAAILAIDRSWQLRELATTEKEDNRETQDQPQAGAQGANQDGR